MWMCPVKGKSDLKPVHVTFTSPPCLWFSCTPSPWSSTGSCSPSSSSPPGWRMPELSFRLHCRSGFPFSDARPPYDDVCGVTFETGQYHSDNRVNVSSDHLQLTVASRIIWRRSQFRLWTSRTCCRSSRSRTSQSLRSRRWWDRFHLFWGYVCLLSRTPPSQHLHLAAGHDRNWRKEKMHFINICCKEKFWKPFCSFQQSKIIPNVSGGK